MANKYDKLFMKIASDLAEMSHCCRVQVGAVIVREGRIISTGWNGTPPGHQNCDDYFAAQHGVPPHAVDSELHSEFSKYEIHAEVNAVIFAGRSGRSVEGTTVYCTVQPCLECAKTLIAAGVKRIVYLNAYDRITQSTEQYNSFFEKSGIKIEKMCISA